MERYVHLASLGRMAILHSVHEMEILLWCLIVESCKLAFWAEPLLFRDADLTRVVKNIKLEAVLSQ